MYKLKNYFLVFIGFLSINVNAQLALTDSDYDPSNPLDCGVVSAITLNFIDGPANYSPNMNETLVLCPDLTQGSKVSIVFATNIGSEWNVDPTDTLYIYDGPNTSAPLLGAYNSGTNPSGFFIQASFENNPSGCLTLQFVSNGAVEGTGWIAHVACSNAPQPFFPHIEAHKNGVGPNVLNPIDTGYVDVCFGDSIMFVALPEFPYSLENAGTGYSQNANNSTYEWTVAGIGTFTNDTLWFTPPQRTGYFIDLRVTDVFPQIERITCKVRVSVLPSFAGTGPVDDTVCLGQTTNLIGGTTPTDTVGIDIPAGDFQIGGTFAGLTYLPDGTGAQYQTTIPISGFDAGTTVTSGADIDQLCLDIEHSYLGDLEIVLTCPNGTTVSLWNGYDQPGGLVPGGCGNSISTMLGNDTDIDGGVPGTPVLTYCFSETGATLGTMCAENAAGNWITNTSGWDAMNPNGVYTPDGAWSGFIGCPINGNWTITVQDNQFVDDGYIFQWGLYFNSALYPDAEGYQNYIVSEFWTSDPSIISGQNDTLLVVQPNTPGDYFYTFNVVDDYGCPYDTVVSLFVQPLPAIFNDTIACDMALQVSGTTAYNGGTWSTTSSELTFSPSATTANPLITTSVPGTYAVTYTDVACNQSVTAEIIYPPYPVIFSDTSLCNLSMQVSGTQAYSTGGVWTSTSPNVSFNASNAVLNPTIVSSVSGTFTVTFTDNVCNNSVSANIEQIEPPSIFSDTIGCNLMYQVWSTTSYAGGMWSCPDTAITFYEPQYDNPTITTSTPGTYTFTYTDNECNMSISSEIYFPPYAYTQVLDTVICIGSTYSIIALDNYTVDNFIWNTGSTLPTIQVNGAGEYIVTASNVCHSYTDTATIGVKVCEIDAPNVLVLSSLVGNNAFFVQYEGVAEFECAILNRWGNKIYEYFDPAGKWDGYTQGGNLVEEGTYFYIIKATFEGGQEVTKQGFVQLRY